VSLQQHPRYPRLSIPAIIILFPLCATLATAQTSTELKQLAHDRLAQLDGTLSIPGLDSSVEVRRDRWGVPHIYARTQHDVFFAQGFVAAQDRLFQMDMWRRIGEGRLAEVFGPRFVERDRFARMWRYRGDMNAEWTSYAPDTKSIATAFVDGVNAYIAVVRDRPPVEYAILHIAPEPWTPDVPLQRMAALSMTGNADAEIFRAQLVAAVGPERAGALLPTIPHRDLDPAPGLDLSAVSSASLGGYGQAAGPLQLPRIVGSNNWVVSGSRTVSGKPLLANDPHRYLDNPSLRYITHLVAPGWNVIGGGEPGVPGVAAGHNDRIGFGFTIVGMDQQDVYVETLRPCEGMPAETCYLHDGAWKPVRVVPDTIAVHGERPRIVQLLFTEHGPIVHEDTLIDGSGQHRGYALRFVGSEPGTAGYLAQLSVDRAHDWNSFLRAAARWKLPTENLIYADVDGNIGWIAAGLMPKRSWSGLLPVPGTGGFEWTGFRTVDELPKAFNPARGFINTSNNDIRPDGYDVPLNFEFATPFRAHRVTEVLADRSRKFDVASFERLQHDVISLQARTLVPELLATGRRAGLDTLWAYRQFSAWDHGLRTDGAAPVLFELWKRALSRAALSRVAPAAARSVLRGDDWIDNWASPDDALASLSAATRDTIMIAAVDSALAFATRQFGPDRSAWRWGTLHLASFPHHLAAAFDPTPVQRAGDGETVNSTAGAGFSQQYGASYREIIDFADWDRSVATNVPGQSGQPGSEYYENLLPLWARGEYFPLAYSRAAVERETRHVLWLRPATTPATSPNR
jgi:penicillin G amidase